MITYINVQSGIPLDGFTIKNGLATSNGAGIYCVNSSGTITNCFVTKNRAIEYCGGIGCYYGSSPIIDNCTIKGNFAGIGGGGGIDCDDLNAPVIITNCLITENVSTGYRAGGGGGIRCINSSAIITHCTISKNRAFLGGGIHCSGPMCNPIISDCIIEKNSALGKGGGIYCYCSPVTINNCQINKNSANSNGGAIYCAYLTNWDDIDWNITNCTISRNRALKGGGIQFSGYLIPLIEPNIFLPKITNCTITGNIAFFGGGVSNFFSSPIVTDSIIRRNFPNQIIGRSAITRSIIERRYEGRQQ